MTIAKMIAAIAVSTAAVMMACTAAAYADAVTATVCRDGGGRIKIMPDFPHVCMGGQYDGAEVWS